MRSRSAIAAAGALVAVWWIRGVLGARAVRQSARAAFLRAGGPPELADQLFTSPARFELELLLLQERRRTDT